jgi:hypothetical protein
MSELVSSQPLKEAPAVEVEVDFPYGAPIKGKVYVMDHNYRTGGLEDGTDHTVRIIVMSEESWGDFGTKMETARQILRAQDTKIRTMAAEGAARDRVNADLLSRLDALRAIRRAEKRPEVEADLNLPKGN